MNIGLLSLCKILSLVLLCRLYVVACDHSGSTDDSNHPDAHSSALYYANINNYNRSGRRPKVIIMDRYKSEKRPRDSYRYRTQHHRDQNSRRIIDFRTINNPKMMIQNDEDKAYKHRSRPRERRPPPPPRDQTRSEYLKRKVLMLLDLNNTKNPYGYDVTFDGDKTICKALHPYLFGMVKRGDTTLWKPKSGDYPYKVVCRTKGGQETCKVFFPDYKKDYPPSKPTRVDVFKKVSGRLYGPEHWAGKSHFDTHAYTSPEMHGQSGQIKIPPHIPTGEVKPTPHTSLDVNLEDSNMPQDEAEAGGEALSGEQIQLIDDPAQPQEGEQATEDIKVDEGPGVVPAPMPAPAPTPMSGAYPGDMPRSVLSDMERASHVDLMSDYFNENFGQVPRPEFHPVHGHDMRYHVPRRHHRSSRRDQYNEWPFSSHGRHHRQHHRDFHDTPHHASIRHDKYPHGTREFRDHPTAAYQSRPEPTIPVPLKRTDFKSQISPRDVLVNTDQSKHGDIDFIVDRKKPENLVLTFASKSNVYVIDGAHHTFALNQTGGETGTNDQNSANNPNSGNNPHQRIIFNGEDPNRVSLEAGSVRISFPSQVIEGIPMPTGIQTPQNTASVQNSRPAGGVTGNATISSNANASPQSSQRTNQQPVSQAPRQQPVSQAPRQQAVTQQGPRPQQLPRQQAVSQQAVSQQPPRPQQPTQQAQPSEGQDSGVDITFADD
ncbi:hypothetical protein MACK_000417 [Theileria orientalis]|uniref:Uncharacterized protein n=1 Tax=Theileria orientalis TaxID=68886 RepID=A0A976QT60_THEOR|nr:hypothetical protein MACK_000417 [Theileria orientalis]